MFCEGILIKTQMNKWMAILISSIKGHLTEERTCENKMRMVVKPVYG
jgi:hypothetical protein